MERITITPLLGWLVDFIDTSPGIWFASGVACLTP